jgi:hypothetical protein
MPGRLGIDARATNRIQAAFKQGASHIGVDPTDGDATRAPL